ncbi:GatB/YqeY domain-containing protein [Mesorhizobium sp. CAU 1741]|uniref:GatB/YqeY domain-containing protein n=1 Tax=Mesorhizobium sp. CAU 1741 TaxID=3140366 RepID=UPI00325BFCDE
MRDQVSQALKDAQKSQDKQRVSTLRLINAAIQDRDIANRGSGKGQAGDDEILQILTKMVKQREESAKAFDDGGRPELAEKERSEIEIVREFLPSQMDEDETRAAIAQAVSESGAESVRDMGKVMAILKERHTGRIDFSRASGIIKEMLSR